MGLKQTAAKGVLWTTSATIVRSIMSLLQVSILTRYLSKDDFGVVAIATLFIGFSQIFMDMGISNGIMHKQDTSPRQYSSLFWVNVIMGAFLSIVVFCLSPLVAKAYSEPELIKILSLLGLSLFFSSLGSQHKTVQQKKFRFKYIAINEIVTALLTLVVAFVLAKKGYGVYSLVYSTIFNSFFSNILFLIIGLVEDRNISLHLCISEIVDYFKIGSYAIGSQVLNYFARELDVVIISAILGKETLGVYSLCKKLVQSVYNAVNPILMKVLTPILAQLQSDKKRISSVYVSIVETLALTNFPIYFLIAILSKGILLILYGPDYVEAAVVLSLLSIYYGYLSTGNPIGSLQVAMGRTDLGMYWDICRLIIVCITLYVGAQFDINIMVIALLLSSIASIPLFWRITIKPLISCGCVQYFFLAAKPFCITFIISLPYAAIAYKNYDILTMILVAVLFVASYCFIANRFFKKSYIVSLIKNNWSQLKNRL